MRTPTLLFFPVTLCQHAATYWHCRYFVPTRARASERCSCQQPEIRKIIKISYNAFRLDIGFKQAYMSTIQPLKGIPMDMTGQLKSANAALAYTLAGNATLTLRSQKSGTRYTYRVRQLVDDAGSRQPLHFVSTLFGPDNESDFVYLGIIGNQGEFRLTKKSRFTVDSPQAKAFGFFWRHANAPGDLPDALECWHEGRCGRCGRKLTVPASIASGFGPECLSKL
jgi:hypothetical protein